MTRTLTIFFILINGALYSQLSSKVSELVSKLSKVERADSKFVGYAGSESEIYKLYDSISKIATNREVEYLAFNGSPIVKYYFSKKLVESKSKKLTILFQDFIKKNDSVKVIEGCVGTTLNLTNDLYQEIYSLPRHLEEMEDFQQAIKSNKYPIDEQLKEILEYKSKWNLNEAKKMIIEFDKIALDDENSPLGLIEYICMINQYYENKIPYFQKLHFFEKKYNSKLIAEYITFCENR